MTTPPYDNELQDNSQIVPPVQQRKRQAGPRRPPSSYSANEHPEIPIAKRASLRLDRQNTDARLPETDEQLRIASRDSESLPKVNTRPKAAKARGPYQVPEVTSFEKETDEHSYRPEERTYGYTSGKMKTASKGRHPYAYERPLQEHRPIRSHTRQFHTQRPFLTQVMQLRHNSAVVILGLLAVALLILLPISIFGILSATRPSTTSTVSTNSGQSPPTSVQQLPLNPHELIITPRDTDHPPPPVFATSAYLLDADTGATLYAHNPFMHLPMLSTTKLMTAILTVEQGNMDQRITITDAMMRQIGQLSPDSALFHVKKGEVYTLRDLLYGLLFVSGNDAALIIADTIGGSVPHFVDEMNARAHQLGMNDTHFMNPHGLLQAGQYSSAHDLAILGRYSMSLPLLHKMSGERIYSIPQGGNHPDRGLTNENQFLWWYPGVDGGKTGFDGVSDFIQVISCIRNNHHLIGVVMHTNNWWTDMRDLMNWGFSSFSWISPYDVEFQHPIPFDYLWDYFAKDKKENTISTADSGRYFVYTGYSVSGPILQYFDMGSGLKKFGYPVKMPTVPGASLISQQFEHGTIQCNLTANTCQTV